MYILICHVILLVEVLGTERQHILEENASVINIVDLTKGTTRKAMSEYYNAIEKRWKICMNCGFPGLGTAMHLDYSNSPGSMHPAVIPTEFLLTRLSVIDVTSLTKLNPSLVLTLDVALQWMQLKYDPREPTLLLFKFSWVEDPDMKRTCMCKIPGLSYELAEWISANLSHVVGVATDAPTLESEQTREFTTRTVSNLLGRSGVYMIENVNVKRKIPESGCMAVAMPLKLLNSHYVPTRLTAFCPTRKTDHHVMLALKKTSNNPRRVSSRVYDVSLEEIMS